MRVRSYPAGYADQLLRKLAVRLVSLQPQAAQPAFHRQDALARRLRPIHLGVKFLIVDSGEIFLV